MVENTLNQGGFLYIGEVWLKCCIKFNVYFFFLAVKNVGFPSFSTENLIFSSSKEKIPNPLNSAFANSDNARPIMVGSRDDIFIEYLIPRFVVVPVNRIFLSAFQILAYFQPRQLKTTMWSKSPLRVLL
jgi:hypothetical protein